MFHIPSIAKIPSAMILGYWPEGDCLPLVSLFGFSGAFTWTSTPQLSRRSDKTTKPVESSGTPAGGSGPGMVWVNTETHVYHKEGSQWYGRTQHGKYMSEQDAIKEGDHADKRESKAKKP